MRVGCLPRRARSRVYLLEIVLHQGFLVPFARPFEVIDFLVLLTHRVVDEVKEVLIAALLSDNHIALVHLHKYLLCAKEIIAIAKTADRQCALHLCQVISDHFIDKVSLNRPIIG